MRRFREDTGNTKVSRCQRECVDGQRRIESSRVLRERRGMRGGSGQEGRREKRWKYDCLFA